jgi:hypothetical protein
VFVEVAGAGGEVEDGAGLVVGELFEEDGGFMVFVEDTGGEVAGEPGIEAREGVGYACADALGFFWVGLFDGDEAFSKAVRVFVGDGEDADAALGAARVADEVVAAAAVGVGYGDVYDLDEGFGQRTSKETTREFR